MKLLKNSIFICILCAVAVVWMILLPLDKGEPRHGQSFSIRNLINVHESPIEWLEVAGKKYPHVLGRDPYYLTFDQSDLCFFVTAGRGGNIAHFVFMGNGRICDISINDYNLGGGVGWSKDHYECDEVYGYHWPVVVIKRSFNKYVDFYKFDLIKGTCVKNKK